MSRRPPRWLVPAVGAAAGVLILFGSSGKKSPPKRQEPGPMTKPTTTGPDRYPAPAGAWRVVGDFDSTKIELSGTILTWTGDLSTDADGSPHAYHPDDWGSLEGRSPRGLDAPENAVYYEADRDLADWRQVRRWAGIATDGPKGTGRPLIQGKDDPAPGFFVSKTALGDVGYKSGNPRRYVDAETIPYLSVPSDLTALGVKMGDVAAVEYGDQVVFAEVADAGPAHKIGEGSLALVRRLGFDVKDARGSGDKPDEGFRTYLFIGSGTGEPLSVEEINARAQPLYDKLRAGPKVA